MESLTGAAVDLAQNAAISKGIDYVKGKIGQDFAEGAGNNTGAISKVLFSHND